MITDEQIQQLKAMAELEPLYEKQIQTKADAILSKVVLELIREVRDLQKELVTTRQVLTSRLVKGY